MPDTGWLRLLPERKSWIPGRSRPKQTLSVAAGKILTADRDAPHVLQTPFFMAVWLIHLARILERRSVWGSRRGVIDSPVEA